MPVKVKIPWAQTTVRRARGGWKIMRGEGRKAVIHKPRYHSGIFRDKATADIYAYWLREG